MTNQNGIIHYLKSFYRFNQSYNEAQAGFVNLSTAYSTLLSNVNDTKKNELKIKQDAVNAQLDAVKAQTINTQGRADAEKELTKRQNNLKERELEYEILIQGLTPIVTAVQQQVKTNSSGAAMLPQIGEAVLAVLSKAVELASSIRV